MGQKSILIQGAGGLLSESTLRVFRSLCKDPSRALYKRQLEKDAGLAKLTVSKAVSVLLKHDLLDASAVGRAVCYKLNLESPVVKQIRVLLTIVALQDFFKDFEEAEVYLYGSHSRGEDTKESDIDLLFIGKAPRDQIRKACDELEEKTGKKVSPITHSRQEFAMLAQNESNRAFYENLIRNRIKVNRWT